MTIETRDFGALDISEDGILELIMPILGFEEQRRFVILYDNEMGDSLAWLQSVSDKDTCFIIADPMIFTEDYTPEIPADALSKLGLKEGEAALRCLMVIPKQVSRATVNLKSPLVINPAKKIGAQVVLDGDYPVRAALKSFEGVL